MNTEMGISLEGHEYTIKTAKDLSYITFEKGPLFEEHINNQLKISDGRTIGQATRDELHSRLDAWINGLETIEAKLKEKNG
jgi:hypothetical protein